jgi:hypothetical protein
MSSRHAVTPRARLSLASSRSLRRRLGAPVEREGRNGEARWVTLDRLLGELAMLRGVVAGWSAEAAQTRRHAGAK